MSTYEISKSSLLSLKAEILRKQEEVNKFKLQNNAKIVQQTKKATPLDLKNKGLSEREKNDFTEDEDLLKRSRTVLEAKSKLYDQLASGVGSQNEENARFLVRFDKKQKQNSNIPPDDIHDEADNREDSDDERHFSDEYEPATNPGDEWVEYVDCLGRTRKCLRKDLDYIKEKDSDLKSTVEPRDQPEEKEKPEVEHEEPAPVETEFNESSELLSSDMRRELLRQQWEKEEEELTHKSDIHYQDILFNEARSHGVGYYSFSKDEEERARQQEALRKLRDETREQQKKAEELRLTREKQIAARVKAARNRKRARMGLPPEEDDPEPPQQEEENKETKADEKKQEELQEKEKERMRKKHIRPWDMGKEGVKEHYELTQEEWVKKQRKERQKEFAPPVSYVKDSYDDYPEFDKSLYFTTKKPEKRRNKEPDTNKLFVDITRPPPVINNPSKNPKNPYKSKESKDSTKNDEEQASKGKNPYKTKDSRNYGGSDKSFEPVPIVNECIDFDDEQDRLLQDYHKLSSGDFEATRVNDTDSDDSSRGRGVEIAPPPTFEYYGPSGSTKRKRDDKPVPLEESISAGLKFLRQQAEKKRKSTNHPTEMFLL